MGILSLQQCEPGLPALVETCDDIHGNHLGLLFFLILDIIISTGVTMILQTGRSGPLPCLSHSPESQGGRSVIGNPKLLNSVLTPWLPLRF